MSDNVGNSPRDANRLRMLQALMRDPARSRAELGRALGLSRATVTALLAELDEAGMVEQQADGPDDERRPPTGRPPLHVSLASGAAFAVGLDFGHRHIRAAVCDLAGRIVTDRWSPADVDQDPIASLDLAQRLTQEALADAGLDRDHVIGVGVGLAAPVDPANGSLHAAGMLSAWSGIRPAAELEARLRLPVLVENDANAGAIGEHAFGAGRGVDDMMYVQVSAGVGVGLILGGRPYHGATGIAGEIGHNPAIEHGLICRCGSRGCLETVASSQAVCALLEQSRGEPVPLPRLLDLVRAGDRGARRAVGDAGEAVGNAIAASVNLLNPTLVIIGGALAAAGDILLDPIRRAVEQRAIAPSARTARITKSALGDRAEVLGAAAIQLDRAPQALANRLHARARARA